MIPCGKALLQEWGVIKGKRGCESKKMSLFGLYFQHSDLPWVVGAYKRKIAFSLRSKQPRRLVIAGFQKKGKKDCAFPEGRGGVRRSRGRRGVGRC